MLSIAFVVCVFAVSFLTPLAYRLACGPAVPYVSIEERCARELARQMHRDIPGLATIVERNKREAAFRAAYPGARQDRNGKWRDGRGRFIKAA